MENSACRKVLAVAWLDTITETQALGNGTILKLNRDGLIRTFHEESSQWSALFVRDEP